MYKIPFAVEGSVFTGSGSGTEHLPGAIIQPATLLFLFLGLPFSLLQACLSLSCWLQPCIPPLLPFNHPPPQPVELT